MNRVFICGYFGFDNSGDEGILRSAVDGLRDRVPQLPITVLSQKPQETASAYGVDAVDRRDYGKIAAAIKPGDLFLSGGGGLLQDATGPKSIAYYLGLLQLAKMRGARTMIFAQGIGPIGTFWGKFLTPRVLNGVDLITVRDENSSRRLMELGVKRPVQVTADLVLALKPAPEEAVEAILIKEGIPPRAPKAAFSLRNWENCPLEEIVASARRIFDELKLFPVFIPFQAEQDAELCGDACRITGAGKQLRGRYSPQELMGLFSRMELTVGMRLHSLIYSSLNRVPALGLAYDPKVQNFLDLMDLPGIPYKQIKADLIVSQVKRLWEGRENIKQKLDKRVTDLKTKAEENFRLALELLNKE